MDTPSGAETADATTALNGSANRASRAVVLVIEDEPDVAKLLHHVLGDLYEVHQARDGREGLKKATTQPPDLILCDLMMQGMSGLELVRLVRSTPELSAVPIVVLTALRDARLRAELLRDGAQDYLTKPFEREELLARVAHHIAVGRAREALRAEVSPDAEPHEVPAQDLAELAEQVTASKRSLETTLETLRQSRALYHALARDFAHASGIFFDCQLRFTAVQGEGFFTPLVASDQIVGKTVAEAFPPSLATVMEPHFRTALAGISTTFELPDPDDQGRLSLMRVMPVRDDSGQVTGGLAVVQDVHEHQLEEDEWQSFQARILSQVEDAVNAIDSQHRILYWNHAAERLYGVRAEEALGRTLEDIYAFEWIDGERADVLEALQHEGFWKGECRHRLHRDGREILVDVSLSLLREPGGSAVGYLAVIRDITARKRAEQVRTQLENERNELLLRLQLENEETRRLQERLHLQIERMPIACILWDTDFRALSWNPAATTIFGYAADEVVGQKGLSLLVPPDVQPQVGEIWQRLLHGDSTANSVNQNLTKDGRTIFCEWSNTPLTEPGGTVSGVLSMVQDITARVQAEETLRRSEELFRLTFEQAAVGVAHIGADGRWLRANQKLSEILGYSREEILSGMRFQELTHPDDLARNLDLFEQAVAGKTSNFSLEKRYVRKDGQVVWCSITMATTRESHEHEPYFIGVIIDISEKKRSEFSQQLLAEASAALAASLDYDTTIQTIARLCVPSLAEFCVIDLVGPGVSAEWLPESQPAVRRVLARHANEEFADLTDKILNYPPRFVPGSIPAQVLSSKRPRLVAQVTDEMLRVAAHDEDHLLLMRQIQARSSVLAPLVARGQVIGMVTLSNSSSRPPFDEYDLALIEEVMRRAALALENAHLYSEAEKARREAEDANRAKDEFLAVVSHELRTPLTPILGWVSMLRDEAMAGVLDEKTQSHALATIQRSAEIQAQLIDDLLDVSRIISGTARLHIQPVRLRAVVETALETARSQAKEKNVALWTSFDTSLGMIEGDSRRLQQVVANLLSNAVKFTPPSGRVEIQLAAKDDFAELMVRDSGIGIEEEFLPQIFERFSQADSSTSRAYGGLGLGLSIARHIVELHGGTIAASSAGKNQGATLIVRLPVMPPAEETHAQHSDAHATPADDVESEQSIPLFQDNSLAGKSILVVDDEPATRDMLAQVLRHSGADVEVAESAAGAREVLARWRPAMLICDIGMPQEDGYTFIKFVRALHPDDGGTMPAIALTAYARTEDRDRALAAGFNRHVSKPVAPADLINTINDLMPAPEQS